MDVQDLVTVLQEQGAPTFIPGPEASAIAARYGVVLNSTRQPVSVWTLAAYLIPRLPKEPPQDGK